MLQDYLQQAIPLIVGVYTLDIWINNGRYHLFIPGVSMFHRVKFGRTFELSAAPNIPKDVYLLRRNFD